MVAERSCKETLSRYVSMVCRKVDFDTYMESWRAIATTDGSDGSLPITMRLSPVSFEVPAWKLHLETAARAVRAARELNLQLVKGHPKDVPRISKVQGIVKVWSSKIGFGPWELRLDFQKHLFAMQRWGHTFPYHDWWKHAATLYYVYVCIYYIYIIIIIYIYS